MRLGLNVGGKQWYGKYYCGIPRYSDWVTKQLLLPYQAHFQLRLVVPHNNDKDGVFYTGQEKTVIYLTFLTYVNFFTQDYDKMVKYYISIFGTVSSLLEFHCNLKYFLNVILCFMYERDRFQLITAIR